MDEFEFHPSNWSPGDTTFENPNYHEFVENVKDENPDTDFRTANEKLEDEKRDELLIQKEQLNFQLKENQF